MEQVRAWLDALRLRTLPLSVAGILTGSMCAKLNGYWSWGIFTWAMTTTLLFQILSNLANDLGDSLKGADNSDRIGPMRSVQSGKISKTAMRNAVIFCSLLAFVAAGLLIYTASQRLSTYSIFIYAGLAVACVIAAITYTIGKKAYGYAGFGDVFVFVFFGLVSVLGVYPLYANQLPLTIALPAISIGLWSTAVLNLNNMRDQENDKKVGKNTLVVKLGPEKSKNYHSILIVIGWFTWLLFLIIENYWLGLISVLPLIIFIKHLVFVSKTSVFKEFDSQLKLVALGTFFVSLLLVISVILTTWIH